MSHMDICLVCHIWIFVTPLLTAVDDEDAPPVDESQLFLWIDVFAISQHPQLNVHAGVDKCGAVGVGGCGGRSGRAPPRCCKSTTLQTLHRTCFVVPEVFFVIAFVQHVVHMSYRMSNCLCATCGSYEL